MLLYKHNITEEEQLNVVTKVPYGIRDILEWGIIPSEAVQIAAVKHSSTSMFYLNSYAVEVSQDVKDLHYTMWCL